MYQSLYRKYRPTNFDEVVGQKIIIQTLKNAVKNNQISHAYLFAGPRGTGKTSIAKILAKIVNCENLEEYNPCNKCVNCTQFNNKQAVDIIEIDAASNNGVEEIRELKNKISLVPSIGKYKIYIIDEVHMLSTGAFNALLKTLEEPPEHIIFILATTDPHKIPTTILSRCQRFDFKKIDLPEIIKRLNQIIKLENIKINDSALEEIARLSDGGMRDSLSLLDQAIAYAEDDITLDDIHEINGTITPNQMKELIENISNHNLKLVFETIDSFNENGKDFYKLTEEIILFLRNILMNRMIPNLNKNDINIDLSLTKDDIINYIELFNSSLSQMKNTSNMKLIFELTIIKIIDLKKVVFEKVNDSIEITEKPIIFKKQISKEKLEKIIEIRINNTLCNFNKKEYLDFKNNIIDIKNYQFDATYSDMVNLILDGDIKAYGESYYIIVFQIDNMAIEFNNNIEIIDDLMEKTFNKVIHGIAVDKKKWEIIKTEFNNKEKEYTYIEEEKL